MKDEALRLALEALEAITKSNQSDHQAEIAEDAITAIKAALEEKDEPVAWIYKGEKSFDGNKWSDEYELTASKQVALWKDKDAKPLYTTPPQRTWVGLTDEEMEAAIPFGNLSGEYSYDDILNIILLIQAKLRSKND